MFIHCLRSNYWDKPVMTIIRSEVNISVKLTVFIKNIYVKTSPKHSIRCLKRLKNKYATRIAISSNIASRPISVVVRSLFFFEIFVDNSAIKADKTSCKFSLLHGSQLCRFCRNCWVIEVINLIQKVVYVTLMVNVQALL